MKNYKRNFLIVASIVFVYLAVTIIYYDGVETIGYKTNYNGDYVAFAIRNKEYAHLNDDAGYIYTGELSNSSHRIRKSLFSVFKAFKVYDYVDSEGDFVKSDRDESDFLDFSFNVYYNTDIILPKLNLSDIDCLLISGTKDELQIYDSDIISKIIDLIKNDDLESLPFKDLTAKLKFEDNIDEVISFIFRFKGWDNLSFFIAAWKFDLDNSPYMDLYCNYSQWYKNEDWYWES